MEVINLREGKGNLQGKGWREERGRHCNYILIPKPEKYVFSFKNKTKRQKTHTLLGGGSCSLWLLLGLTGTGLISLGLSQMAEELVICFGSEQVLHWNGKNTDTSFLMEIKEA